MRLEINIISWFLLPSSEYLKLKQYQTWHWIWLAQILYSVVFVWLSFSLCILLLIVNLIIYWITTSDCWNDGWFRIWLSTFGSPLKMELLTCAQTYYQVQSRYRLLNVSGNIITKMYKSQFLLGLYIKAEIILMWLVKDWTSFTLVTLNRRW